MCHVPASGGEGEGADGLPHVVGGGRDVDEHHHLRVPAQGVLTTTSPPHHRDTSSRQPSAQAPPGGTTVRPLGHTRNTTPEMTALALNWSAVGDGGGGTWRRKVSLELR